MKMIVEHYRIPKFEFLELPKKGMPHPALLYEYHKGFGFTELISHVKPNTKGGATFITITDTDDKGSYLFHAMAICSMSDNFSYKVGKEIALLRVTNLGLEHDNLDSGVMYRLDNFEKFNDEMKLKLLESVINAAKTKFGIVPNTMYFHPEDAKIMPEIDGFTLKTSKIILKNHIWIGFEEK